MAASTALGRLVSSPVKNSRHTPSVIEQKTSANGVRAPALSLTADCDNPPPPDSPGPAATARLAAPSPRNSCRAFSRSHAWRRSPGPPRRLRYRQAAGRRPPGERSPRSSTTPSAWQLETPASPIGISPVTGTPRCGSSSKVATTIDNDDDGESDRPARQKTFTDRIATIASRPIANTNQLGSRRAVRRTDHALEEIVPATGYAEQARQLGHEMVRSRARLEADEDAVADELHSTLSRNSQAIRQSNATANAARLAICA